MPEPHTDTRKAKPTGKQLAYLRALADRTGQTFAYPRTSTEASAEIRRLRSERPTPRADRVRERKQIADDLVVRTGTATRVLNNETTGYGSSATWKRGRS